MKKTPSCPKCKSNKVELVNYIGVKCIKCDNCGYDETLQYEVSPEQRSSQKAKGGYSPYKKGGHGRIIK